MKKIVVFITLIFVVVGCGATGTNSKDVTCTLDSGDSQVTDTVDISYKDDQVSSIVATREAALADYLFEDRTVEELEELYKTDYVNPEKEQKGIDFVISIDKEKKMLKVKMTIDPKVASEEDMSNLGLKDYKHPKNLTKQLESQNYNCGKVE